MPGTLACDQASVMHAKVGRWRDGATVEFVIFSILNFASA